MIPITSFIKHHSLIAFFILAFGGFWPMLPLTSVSPSLPLFIGTFMPALAAILVTRIAEGKDGLKALRHRLTIWRVNPVWYIAALGLAVVIAFGARELAHLLGSPAVEQAGGALFLIPMFFIFAIGEELGWRGFALPRLMKGRSPLSASLILGTLWAIWHWPVLLPGQALADTSLLTHSPLLIASSVLYGWIFQHSRGSVVTAVMLHGAQNAAGVIFLSGVEPTTAAWLTTALYGVAAIVVVLAAGSSLKGEQIVSIDEVSVGESLA
jgi:membrane protease YdiL (CAAX protease family)